MSQKKENDEPCKQKNLVDTPIKNPMQFTTATTSTTTGTASPGTNPLRLLVDKLVFLDITSSFKQTSRLKECLDLIGARFADCLSKEVDYVITNRDIPKQPRDTSPSQLQQSSCLTPADKLNRISNTECASSESARKKPKLEILKRTPPNAMNMFSRSKSVVNRTHAIMEKASKGLGSSNDIIATANRLGIKVMSTSDLDRYIERMLKKKSLELANDTGAKMNDQKFNFGLNVAQGELVMKKSFEKQPNSKIFKLKSPFLKFESICKQYKPIYYEFNEWHDIDLNSTVKTSQSPFQNYFSDDKRHSSNERSRSSSADNRNTNNNEAQESAGLNSTSRLLSHQNSNVKLNASSNQQQLLNMTTPNKIIQSNNTPPVSGLAGASGVPSITPASRVFQQYNSGAAGKNSNAWLINLGNTVTAKKKTTGYCECCKHRYDNLKQHLTSAQHENFDRNPANFKELDEFINGVLSFDNFLKRKNLKNVDGPIQTDEDSISPIIVTQQPPKYSSDTFLNVHNAASTTAKPTDIGANEKIQLKPSRTSIESDENSFMLGCGDNSLDDVVVAFINDFSYEILQK